jgi:hypothetical protein
MTSVISEVTMVPPMVATFTRKPEKVGETKKIRRMLGLIKGQGICSVGKKCLYNKELDTITTCSACFGSTTICDYWNIP